jgi:hypothetical protein
MERRPRHHIREDLRAWLDMLATYERMKDRDGIALARREIEAMEDELNYSRYGTTAVC